MDRASVILGLVSEGNDSRTQIEKALKKRGIAISREDIEQALEELVESGMIVQEKKGRYPSYRPKDEDEDDEGL